MSEGRGVSLPIACSLSGPRFATRREEVSGLLRQSTRKEELDDGYAFEFDGSAQRARELVDFISVERSCCQFFLFELVFEPGEGSIWLRVRGPEGTAEFLGKELLSDPV